MNAFSRSGDILPSTSQLPPGSFKVDYELVKAGLSSVPAALLRYELISEPTALPRIPHNLLFRRFITFESRAERFQQEAKLRFPVSSDRMIQNSTNRSHSHSQLGSKSTYLPAYAPVHAWEQGHNRSGPGLSPSWKPLLAFLSFILGPAYDDLRGDDIVPPVRPMTPKNQGSMRDILL